MLWPGRSTPAAAPREAASFKAKAISMRFLASLRSALKELPFALSCAGWRSAPQRNNRTMSPVGGQASCLHIIHQPPEAASTPAAPGAAGPTRLLVYFLRGWGARLTTAYCLLAPAYCLLVPAHCPPFRFRIGRMPSAASGSSFRPGGSSGEARA